MQTAASTAVFCHQPRPGSEHARQTRSLQGELQLPTQLLESRGDVMMFVFILKGKVRMKLLAAVVLVAGLVGVAAWGSEAFAGDEQMGTCVFEKLTGQDYKFCRGDLEVFYPELGDVGCTYIPKCNQYRKRISKEWRSPTIVYPQADKWKKPPLGALGAEVDQQLNIYPVDLALASS
ncbi:Phosphatidylethanolamine-binding protein 4 [Chelonia mydas]|uniref:Phosphatidylethanolamine-binding protein 4 n=1 Tax=Chelonia mydas TaxID=8469 RepID=M7AR42_CHEMY|nr:Phosphatidylethanolamine-binding protein 4 [Chelonia mydas]